MLTTSQVPTYPPIEVLVQRGDRHGQAGTWAGSAACASPAAGT